MKIHPKLINLYNSLELSCPKACQLEENCGKYISCGVKGMCSLPCKKCLIWTGYGGNKSITSLIEKYKE